jgi:radical SAM protein with 4Fe4S-binding SPASM domain
MSMKDFVNLGDQLFPAATFIDLRGFGESTILPYWSEVIDYLERFPFIEWHLVTNLSLPRDESWEKMIRLGFSLGFSCDGATAETFEAIRVRSHFDRILHNLGVIRDSIKKHNRGFIYFISTIQRRNLHELRKIVELAAQYEVPEVQFKMVQGGEIFSKFDPAEVKLRVSEALDAAIDLGVRVTFNDWIFTQNADRAQVAAAATDRPRKTEFPFPVKPDFDPDYWSAQEMGDIFSKVISANQVARNQRCFKPFSYTYINYQSDMGTCNHMMFPDMVVMGNLKSQSLREIWNSDKYKDFRRQLITATPQDPRCQWCFKHRMDD